MPLVGVIGGLGFIGRRVIEDLQKKGGYDVRVIDSCSGDVRDGHRQIDVRDHRGLVEALKGCDVVINLAAVHRDDVEPKSRYAEVNVTGAVNVCSACRELGVGTVVFTSSVAVYGASSSDTTEDHRLLPDSAYGWSKLHAEEVYREWQEGDPERRSLVIVRPTVVFGEDNRGNLYELVRHIVARRFVMVGRGRNRKSMAYVGNLSAFMVHVITLEVGVHVFNYVDPPDFLMEELVETILSTIGRKPRIVIRIPYTVGITGGIVCDLIAAVSGKRLPISAVRIRKFCSTTTFSSRRALQTGFRPPFSIRDALIKTIKHELNHNAQV